MTARELTTDGWGKAVLEEVLFRAASQLSEQLVDDGEAAVDVTLACRVRADAEKSCITVELASLVDGAVGTKLTYPF